MITTTRCHCHAWAKKYCKLIFNDMSIRHDNIMNMRKLKTWELVYITILWPFFRQCYFEDKNCFNNVAKLLLTHYEFFFRRMYRFISTSSWSNIRLPTKWNLWWIQKLSMTSFGDENHGRIFSLGSAHLWPRTSELKISVIIDNFKNYLLIVPAYLVFPFFSS